MDWSKVKKDYGPLMMRVAMWLAMVALGALAHWAGVPAPPVQFVEREVIKEVPVNVVAGERGGPEPGFATGWVDDPLAVNAVVGQLPIKSFAATPAFAADGEPDEVFLWLAAKKALGRHVPTRNQGQVGSCVSFGAICAEEYLQCVQIAGGSGEQFKDLSQEFIYGISRVQIGGGRINGDGSVGAWAAQGAQKYGSLARGVYGAIDVTAYNESRCRQWGNSGPPASTLPLAKDHLVKSITTVRTTLEARRALANGCPVTVASNVGFGQRGPYTRDRDGFLHASGSWAHQMCIIGYRGGARPGFYIMNSWGETWVSGPGGLGSPPPGGFWADEATVQRMLNQADSWAYGGLAGFPARKLDWNVRLFPARLLPVTTLARHFDVLRPSRPEVSLSW